MEAGLEAGVLGAAEGIQVIVLTAQLIPAGCLDAVQGIRNAWTGVSDVKRRSRVVAAEQRAA
jgi:hypothetical protein